MNSLFRLISSSPGKLISDKIFILGSRNGRELSENGILSSLSQESHNGTFPLNLLSLRLRPPLTLLQVLVHIMLQGRQAWLRPKLKPPRENSKN